MSQENSVFSLVLNILDKLNIPYIIGGSVAAIAYGEPRLTLDMDVVIKLTPEQARKLANSFSSDYYVNLDSIMEAIENKGHFNIINSIEGIKIDFYIFKDDLFSQEEFKRGRRELFSEKQYAYFASPEDIILKKLEWYKMGESQKHLEDIKGILKNSASILDIPYINKWAGELEVNDLWQKLISSHT